MAGLGRRTFAAGEVLTAGNVMGYLQDQAVMTFAGTAARGSAIGTAVAEGMVSYLKDTNAVQAYDGSAWNSLAYSTAVPSNAQVGLRPVIPVTVQNSGGSASFDSTTGLITATGVSSISLNGVFSAAYKNYRLVLTDLNSASGASTIQLRMRNAGTDNSASSYYQLWTMKRINGTLQDNSGGPSTAYALTTYDTNTTYSWNWFGDINAPFIARNTTVSGNGFAADGSGIYVVNSTVLHAVNSSFDGISFIPTSSTLSASIKIYGYN